MFNGEFDTDLISSEAPTLLIPPIPEESPGSQKGQAAEFQGINNISEYGNTEISYY